jgi:hypothetical protein
MNDFLDHTDPRVVALSALLVVLCFGGMRWLWGPS